MQITTIAPPVEVCGVEYVDVETPTGKHTMLKSKVELVNALHALGLNELGVKAVMNLVESYATDLRRESEID